MSSANDVDSKVVELLFNNENFESNATKSLSTLERLKAALNFSKNTKGFDEVAASAKKFDPSTITSGVNTLHLSLSNLAKVSAFRFLSAEAEKLANNVKEVVKEMSGINGMTAGWGKYASKTESVQTIMAATAKEFTDTGEQMEYVNAQLDKLNWFTDETSYDFLSMVSNIGKFTSNNIALDKSVTAMEGISTWAAKSGANVGEASRAMYNLSQAIAVGSVKLMDWKSIENANMATAEFKETAIQTAVELGTLTKVTDDTFKTLAGHEVTVSNFNQSLSDGWFTSDVLMDTLSKYGAFTDALHDSMEQLDLDITTSDFLDYIDEYKEGTLDLSKTAKALDVSATELEPVLKKLSDDSFDFGRKAFRAAQEAKTFKEAIESVKDAVSTGWMNTFEIIFGDYEQAKKLWTGVANGLWDIFASGGEYRNEYLKEAFQTEKSLTELDWEKLEEVGLASPELIKNIRANTKAHGEAINEWMSDTLWLTTALDKGRLTIEDINEALASIGKTTQPVNEEIQKQTESLKDSDEAFKGLLDTIGNYSAEDVANIAFGDGKVVEGYADLEHSLDSMLTTLGLSQDQGDEFVEVLKNMGYFGGRAAEETHKLTEEQQATLEELELSTKKGSELLSGGIVNSLEIVSNVLATFRNSWGETFEGLSAGGLRDILEGFYRGSENVKKLTENSVALKAVFSGIGSTFNIVTKLLGSGLKIIGTGLSGVINAGGKFVTWLGSSATKLDTWLTKTDLIGKATKLITKSLKFSTDAIGNWVKGFTKMPIVEKNVTRFKNAFTKAMNSVPKLFDKASKGFDNFEKAVKEGGGIKKLGLDKTFDLFKKNVIDKFINFKGFEPIKNAFKSLGTDIKNSLKDAGIDIQPVLDKVTVFGKGVKTAFSMVGPTLKTVGSLAKDAFAKFKELPTIQKAASGIKKAFAGISDSAKTFSKVTVDRMTDFVRHVNEDLGGLTIDNIGTVFKDFGVTVAGIFEDSGIIKKIRSGGKKIIEELDGEFANFEGFDKISESASVAFDTIVEAITGKASISDVVESFSAIKDAIVETFTGTELTEAIKTAFASVGDLIKGYLTDKGVDVDGLIDSFKRLGAAIQEAVSNIKVPKTLGEFFDMIFGVQTAYGAEVDSAAETVEKAGGGLKESIKNITDILTEMEKAAGPLGTILAKVGKPLAVFLGIMGLFRAAKGIIKQAGEAINTLSLGVKGLIDSFSAKNNADAKLKKSLSTMVTLGSLVISVLGILAALAIIDHLNPETIWKNLGIVGLIMGALIVVSAVMNKVSGKGSLLGGLGVLSLVLSIIAIVGLLKLLEVVKINFDKLKENIGSIAAVLLAMLILLGMTRAIGPNAAGAAKTILALVVAIAALTLLMALISQMKWESLTKGLIGVGLLSLFLGKLLKAASDAKGSIASLIGLTILFAVVGNIFNSISSMEWQELEKSIIGVGFITLFISGILKAASKVTSAIGPILALSLLIGVIAGSIYLLASFPDPSAINNAVSCIRNLLIVLTIMGAIMGYVKPAWSGLLMLAVVVGVMAAVIYGITQIKDLEKVQTVVDMLCKAFLSIGAGMLMIGAAGALAQVGMAGFIVIGVVFLVLAGVIALISAFVDDKQAMIEKIEEAGAVIEAIAGVIGRAFGAFIQGVAEIGFGGVSDGIETLAASLMDFATKMNEIGDINIDTKGIKDVVKAVGDASIAGLKSALMSWVSEAVGGKEVMDQFKSDASGLAEALTDWQTEMEGIDSITVPEGISGVVEAINSANISGFGSALGSSVSEMAIGKSTMETFSSDASGLADALTDWQTEMDGIAKIKVPAGISGLVEAINSANISGFGSALGTTVSEMTTGKSTMETFTSDVSGLADALTDWQTEMDGIAKIKVPTGIDTLADKIKEISVSTLVSNIIDSIGDFGNDDKQSAVEEFSKNVDSLANALSNWQTKMEGISKIKVPSEGIEKLIESVKKVPKVGGLINAIKGMFEGETDMTGFSENITTLGEGIKGFTTALGEDIDLEKMTVSAEAASVLGELGNALKGQDFGGWFHEGDLSKFGENLTDFGNKLKTFADTDIDTAKLSTIADSAQTLGRFGNLIQHLDISEENLSSLDSAITQVKTSMDTMKEIDISSGDVANTGKVTKFVANIKALINSINDAAAVEGDVSGFTKALDEMGDAILQSSKNNGGGLSDDAFDMSSTGKGATDSLVKGVTDNAGQITEAFTGAMSDAAAALSDTSAFNSAGTGMVTAIMLGITSTGSLISTALTSAVTSAKNAINTSDFNSVGTAMMSGLAAGINSGKSAAITAAANAAAEAYAAAKAKLDVNSPSKVMMELGEFFTEGFAIGIKNTTYRAVRVAGNMVDRTISTFEQATASIKNVLTADIDGGPVIRPVLDLSEVELGSRRINDMFNSHVPLTVAANANVITSGMNSRNMVTNKDILDALDRLNANLGGNRGDTYNVNGISYDDGSNVSMAVRDLIRAVQVGRRV